MKQYCNKHETKMKQNTLSTRRLPNYNNNERTMHDDIDKIIEKLRDRGPIPNIEYLTPKEYERRKQHARRILNPNNQQSKDKHPTQ